MSGQLMKLHLGDSSLVRRWLPIRVPSLTSAPGIPVNPDTPVEYDFMGGNGLS
jgi:hypothetical protein